MVGIFNTFISLLYSSIKMKKYGILAPLGGEMYQLQLWLTSVHHVVYPRMAKYEPPYSNFDWLALIVFVG